MFIHTGCFCNVSRNGTQAVPYGFAGRRYRSTAQVIFVTLHGDESSPLHCVIPFNHTGCIRNVAGGKIAAPTCVIPFNHTGYIGDVPPERHTGRSLRFR